MVFHRAVPAGEGSGYVGGTDRAGNGTDGGRACHSGSASAVADSDRSGEAGSIMVDMIMNLVVLLIVLGLLGGILMLWRSAK